MTQSFDSLGLKAELVRAVAEEGYTSPTPVQAQAIPLILAGRDVLAGAQTGTGKTAGFTLPMLQRLEHHAHHGGRHAVRALVLTPTRELAAQVEESIRTYGRHTKLRTAIVFGGVGIQPQIDALADGVDILVATPGRLLDHAGQKTVNLSHVEILVLDEADRMLDMGFIHDVKKILALLPRERQNLLFSATFSPEIRELAGAFLRDPAVVQVARPNAESELVTQRIYLTDKGRKRALLAQLVRSGNWHQVLVFTRTKHGANRLAEQLARDGIEAAAIHGNKSQGARTRALAGFKSGDVRVLVATDIAARGLDIEELPHVVNYELPNVPEDYVHRIGRTGRAGCTGEAISLVSEDEFAYLADIEKLVKRSLLRETVPGFEPGTAPAPVEGAPREPRDAQPRPEAKEGDQPEGAPPGERGKRKRRRRGRGRGKGQAQVEAGGQPQSAPAQGAPRQPGRERRAQAPRGEGEARTESVPRWLVDEDAQPDFPEPPKPRAIELGDDEQPRFLDEKPARVLDDEDVDLTRISHESKLGQFDGQPRAKKWNRGGGKGQQPKQKGQPRGNPQGQQPKRSGKGRSRGGEVPALLRGSSRRPA